MARSLLLMAAALLLAGCAGPLDGSSVAPAASDADATAGLVPDVFEFDGGFVGAGVPVAGAVTLQQEGIHHLSIPGGDPPVTLTIEWSGTSPGGIVVELFGGGGDSIATLPIKDSPFQTTLPAGTWRSGDAHMMFGPAEPLGASVQVAYSGSLTFDAAS